MLIAFIVAAVSLLGLTLAVVVNPGTSLRTKAAFIGLTLLGAGGLYAWTLVPAEPPAPYDPIHNPRPDEGVQNYTFEKQELTLDDRELPLLTEWGAIDLADPATYSGHEDLDALREMHREDESGREPKRMKALMDSIAPSEGDRVFSPPAGDWSEIRIIERDARIMLIRKSADTSAPTMAGHIDRALSRYELDPVMMVDPDYEFGRMMSFRDEDGAEVASILVTREGRFYQELVKIDMRVVKRARSLHGIEL